MNNAMYRSWAGLWAALFILLYAANALGRPDMTPLGRNIADDGSAFYHFSQSTFTSADSHRHYRVWVGTPKKRPPPAGYPVLYLLDGNAVIDRLNDGLLKSAAAGSPPVLVIVGYQTRLPFDLHARAYDYTPPSSGKVAGRLGGGSAGFRQLLEKEIAPAVERGIAIDHSQRALWGHSLGGLFVLDTYLVSDTFFTRFYATSPSLNRQYASLPATLAQIPDAGFCHKQLYLLEGSASPGNNPDAPAPEVVNQLHNTLLALRERGLPTRYWSWPAYSHGAMFNQGFQQTLLTFSASQPPIACRT